MGGNRQENCSKCRDWHFLKTPVYLDPLYPLFEKNGWQLLRNAAQRHRALAHRAHEGSYEGRDGESKETACFILFLSHGNSSSTGLLGGTGIQGSMSTTVFSLVLFPHFLLPGGCRPRRQNYLLNQYKTCLKKTGLQEPAAISLEFSA